MCFLFVLSPDIFSFICSWFALILYAPSQVLFLFLFGTFAWIILWCVLITVMYYYCMLESEYWISGVYFVVQIISVVKGICTWSLINEPFQSAYLLIRILYSRNRVVFVSILLISDFLTIKGLFSIVDAAMCHLFGHW